MTLAYCLPLNFRHDLGTSAHMERLDHTMCHKHLQEANGSHDKGRESECHASDTKHVVLADLANAQRVRDAASQDTGPERMDEQRACA